MSELDPALNKIKRTIQSNHEHFIEAEDKLMGDFFSRQNYFASFSSKDLAGMSRAEFLAYLRRFRSFLNGFANVVEHVDLEFLKAYYSKMYDKGVSEAAWNEFVKRSYLSSGRASELLQYLDDSKYIYVNSNLKKGLKLLELYDPQFENNSWQEYCNILESCSIIIECMISEGYENPNMTTVSNFMDYFVRNGRHLHEGSIEHLNLIPRNCFQFILENITTDFEGDLSIILENPNSVSLIEDFKFKYGIFYKLFLNKNVLSQLIEEFDGLDTDRISKFNDEFQRIVGLVEGRESISKDLSDYLDRIYADVDPNIKLDKEQREAVISEDKYSLLIAGAGSGKTTTVTAKVRYLVERLGVDPKEILVTSFTNKAVNELKDIINERMKINARVATFHSFAFKMLRHGAINVPKIEPAGKYTINDILSDLLFKDKDLMRKLVLFFSYYMNIPEEVVASDDPEACLRLKAKQDYETLKSELEKHISVLEDQRIKQKETLVGEYVNSAQEVTIANFLYLNGLEYEYEKAYPYRIHGFRKLYTPDFFIKQGENEVYLEHFGLSEDLKNDMYSEETLSEYIKHIEDKRKIHASCETRLIETWSVYKDGRPLVDHLSEILIENGFILKQRNLEEVYEELAQKDKRKYIYRFSNLVTRFIDLFKTANYKVDEFERLRKRTDNPRTHMFLDIVKTVYVEYQNKLAFENKVDFNDMINYAYERLKEHEEKGISLPCKYIIIDEFQDIAKQRFDFIRQFSKVSDANIVAVGDDWQSIYAFAGSKLNIFTKFIEIMGEGRIMKISHTYRNSQELIDIAGAFVQKNTDQIRKSLISEKYLDDPIVLRPFDDSSSKMYNLATVITDIIGEIIDEFGEEGSILIMGRYNFDEHHLSETGLFTKMDDSGHLRCIKYPYANLTFLTVHRSKGLTFDNTIIMNLSEHTVGFPCQIEDDPILRLLVPVEDSIDFAEERRLFYVALTRTKNRVFLTVPVSRPSRFVIELIHDGYLNSSDELNLDPVRKERSICPVCSFPLKYQRNKNYGLPLYICTNEPEVCDFMTNNLSFPYDIWKCPHCDDGFQVVRVKHNVFYGCTNYKSDGTGCNYTEVIIDPYTPPDRTKSENTE